MTHDAAGHPTDESSVDTAIGPIPTRIPHPPSISSRATCGRYIGARNPNRNVFGFGELVGSSLTVSAFSLTRTLTQILTREQQLAAAAALPPSPPSPPKQPMITTAKTLPPSTSASPRPFSTSGKVPSTLRRCRRLAKAPAARPGSAVFKGGVRIGDDYAFLTVT